MLGGLVNVMIVSDQLGRDCDDSGSVNLVTGEHQILVLLAFSSSSVWRMSPCSLSSIPVSPSNSMSRSGVSTMTTAIASL